MALKSNPVKAVAYLGGDEGGCVRRSAFMELLIGAFCTTSPPDLT